jgi:hypothetical protein
MLDRGGTLKFHRLDDIRVNANLDFRDISFRVNLWA